MKRKKFGFLSNKKHRGIVLLCIILVLIVVFALGICVRSCLYFDDEGAHVIDRYGILEAEAQGSGETLAAEQGSAGEAGSAAEQPTEEEPTDSETPQSVRAVTVSAQSLATDATYLKQLTTLIEEDIVDTVIVDLKTENGYLTIGCTTQILDTSGLTLQYADAMESAVKSLKTAGARIVGRVYCFMDNHATKTNMSLSVKYYESSNWLDYKNNRWLDPENSDSVQYLCDIISSGAALGCDEFLLENFCYPTSGNLVAACYDETTDADGHKIVMEENLQSLQAAANGLPVGLYVDDVTDVDEMSGVVLEDVYESVYRVCTGLNYENQDGIDAVAAELAEITGSSKKLTPFFTGSYGWSQTEGTAVLNTDSSSYAIYDLN